VACVAAGGEPARRRPPLFRTFAAPVARGVRQLSHGVNGA